MTNQQRFVCSWEHNLATICFRMQRRILRRQPSKDDSYVKKILDSPDSFSTPTEESVELVQKSKVATDDLHFNVHSRRADRFKVQFVQIYIGMQEFEAADIDAIVAIYLQASDRLYEVVLIDKHKKTEIVRFYVLEDELSDQMNRRHDAILRMLCKQSSNTTDSCTLPALSVDISADKSNSRRPSRELSHDPSNRSPRRSRCDSVLQHSSPPPPNKPGIPKNPIFKKERAKDPIRYFNLVPGKNKSDYEFKIHAKLSPEDVEKMKQEVGREERRKSIGNGDFSCDDISSTAQNKDIGYFTSVVLHSLYCSRKRKEKTFHLFDDISNHFFKVFNKIPEGIKSTVPTFVDCASIVDTAVHKWEIFDDKTDTQEAKELLDTADTLWRTLSIGSNQYSPRQPVYQQENSLNPNRKRYRLLWQAAYAAVVFTIRQNKSARTEWQKLLDIAKSAKEREALLEMHHKKGKYSNNKAYKGNGISPDEIRVFRENLKSRREIDGGGRLARRRTAAMASL